jgi:hypothetical protein
LIDRTSGPRGRITMNAKFHPGQVVATPGAAEALAESGQTFDFFLGKHLTGDWGDVDDGDRRLNDQALTDGGRLLSAYRTLRGNELWVITEAVGDDGTRASTCLTTPVEY